MSEFKYIVLRRKGETLSYDFPIIFPDKLVHADVAKMLIQMMDWNDRNPGATTVVSAGQINLDNLACFGESETLEIKSRGDDDTILIKNFPYMHGIVTND